MALCGHVWGPIQHEFYPNIRLSAAGCRGTPPPHDLTIAVVFEDRKDYTVISAMSSPCRQDAQGSQDCKDCKVCLR